MFMNSATLILLRMRGRKKNEESVQFSFFSIYLSGLLVLRNLVYFFQVSNLLFWFGFFIDPYPIFNEITVTNSKIFCLSQSYWML